MKLPEHPSGTRRRSFLPRSLRAQTAIALGTFVFLTLLVGVLGVATQVRLSEGNTAADQDRQIQLDGSRFLTGMLNQETSLRGYSLTGLPEFEGPYREGLAEVASTRLTLEREVSDPAGQTRLKAMESRADDWQQWAAVRVAAVDAAHGPLVDNASSSQGKALFDSFRAANSDFQSQITINLNQELARSAMRSNFLIGVSVSAAVLGLTLVLVLAVVVFRFRLRPLEQLFVAASDLAAGRETAIPGVERQDELGLLARALATWEAASRERLTLARSMVEVSGRTELQEVLELGSDRMLELLAADEVVVTLKLPDGLRVVAARPHPFDQKWAAARSPATKADAEREPSIGNLLDEEWDEGLKAWTRRHGLGPFLSLPMISGGDLVGVVSVVREGGKPPFEPTDADRAALLVPPLAAAIRVSRLFADLKLANAELETANRHKGVFLASMSHELRTPLNAILGFSELLIDEPGGGYDAATRRRFLDQIHSSGEHLLGMINDILDLAKIEAGQMELFPAINDVGHVVEEVVASVRPLIDAKRLQVSVSTGAAGSLVADPVKLRQILLNLLSNAIKFTPEDGQVTISARRHETEMEVAVRDTGIGIPAEELESVFEEFRQLDSGMARRQQGTGLGLALTRRFVELHGGRIGVQSQPGQGSSFSVWLPLEPLAAAADGEPSTEDQVVDGDSRPLILAVEDNPSAASLIRSQLEKGGYRVALARDGAEALEKARALLPSAITLDILLPKLDGWEVLTQLKRDPSVRDIPVVVISIIEEISLGRALGAIDYLLKPVDARTLLDGLSRLTFTTKVKEREIRVLVVDDDPAIREHLGEVLSKAGFTVLSAAGGAEAIAIAAKQLPDLVLLDLLMPDVSGFDVAAALKTDPATHSIPILVLSAKDLSADDKERLNGHVEAIVSKGSVPSEELVGWLGRVVKNAKSRGPTG